MNEVIRQLKARKSMRVYTEQEISAEDRALILESAVQAPTAGNQQLYTIIDVTDQRIKDRLVETCDQQPMIAEAKMVLVFCADCKKWYDAYVSTGCEPRHPGTGDLMIAVSDAIIAAQNAVTAAESLGIGSCYIGDIMENCEEQRELLQLPEFVFPVGMVIFGYPTEQQLNRPKPRRVAMKHIVHENGYRVMDAEELEEMWTAHSGQQGYTAWMQAFCRRKYSSDFSREMTRSVSKYLEQYEK